MKYILKRWYELLNEDNQKPFYSDNNKTYNRSEVELQTGKIYNYLNKHNIGKNDFVMINFERCAKSFISMLGIVKAGAAFVVVENDYPKERIEHIYNDLDCKLVIDENLYKEIEKENYIEGYNMPDVHDEAYAVYTSGTTGKPKGVIHEYGIYELSYNSELTSSGEFLHNEDSRFAITSPFNFIATILIFNYSIYAGAHVFIPSYEIIKNPRKIIDYFSLNKINQTFLAPSLIRYIGKSLNDEMELVITGSESADDLSINHGRLLNYYLMSEVGFVITKYDISSPIIPCPIGKPNDCVLLKIDKNNELLVKNEFFRGYVNDDDLTSKSIQDGYYHTGDAVKLDENGNYILTSRLTDMIKINGNRVEPQEIEKVSENIIGSECVCKYFNDNGSSMIVLFYTGPKLINKDSFINELEKELPYYMIPNVVEHIDCIPRTSMGKVDRKALVMPKAYKNTYVEPRNELEARFCKAIEKALHIQKYGINDDFYSFGGDSMKTIEIIGELNLEGLESKHFFLGRTVEKIVELYKEGTKDYISEEEKEKMARSLELPLYQMQNFILYDQLATEEATGYNLGGAYRLSKLVSINKLQKVINKYIKDSSMFATILSKKDNGDVVHKYCPELINDVVVENMSEEEVEELRKNFIKPYKMFDNLLWNIRLIKTSKYNYLFLDVHHILADGTCMQYIGEDIANLYFGKPLSGTNNYFAFLYDKLALEKSQYHNDCIEYAMKTYNKKFNASSPIDKNAGKQVLESIINFKTDIKLKKLDDYLRKKNINRYTLFLSAFALNVAKNLQNSNILMQYLVSSRYDQKNHAGMMIRVFNISSDIEKNACINDLFENIKMQMFNNMAYSALDINPIVNETPILALDDLLDMERINPLFKGLISPINLETNNKLEQKAPAQHNVIQFINTDDDTLTLRIHTDLYRYTEKVQREFMEGYIEVLKRVINEDETLFDECLESLN